MLSGFATAAGTARYRDRFPQLRDAGHFRRPNNVPGAGDLWLSSIGLGTYLGEPDEAADVAYTESITTALRSGINVLDTAINYRHQRSERNIGAALKLLAASSALQRDEVLVCTKAGYLTFDGTVPADPRGYFTREYVERGVIDSSQIAGGMHCMAPPYLENQIERSRHNLGLETIDVFYVHNPESQFAEVSREVFRVRLREAFETLEQQVHVKRLCYYGIATWNALRAGEGERDYINLFEAAALAREAGGANHHFRFVQLPFNLAMPEGFGLANHRDSRGKKSLFQAAQQLGIAVMGSAALYQGQLTQGLPEFVTNILGMKTDTENAIQFARSTPGVASALVGMGKSQHVTANLKPALSKPTPSENWLRLFREK
jgi:aryl-alcohol dehydrogenase-like predicted oxidoreductase